MSIWVSENYTRAAVGGTGAVKCGGNYAASLRAQALSLLARREYSKQELARRLLQYTEDPDEIPPLIEDFEQRGGLSEKRVVEQVMASRC